MRNRSIVSYAVALASLTWTFAAGAQSQPPKDDATQAQTETQTQAQTKHEAKKAKAKVKAKAKQTKADVKGDVKAGTTTGTGSRQPTDEDRAGGDKLVPKAVDQPLDHPTHPEEVTKDQTLNNPANERRREAEDKKAAQAIGTTTTTAAEGVASVERSAERATDKAGRYDVLSVEWNPLGLFVGGRVSLQAEWVPVTHHAVVVSPHFVHTSNEVAVAPDRTESQTFTGFGGELGYRYYTGHRGMNGVFIGPSIIAGAYNASLLDGNQPFVDVGVAADAGVQWILADHLVIGGGVGIEYLHVSHDFHDLPSGPSTIASTGVKPRLLLSIGAGL